MSRSLKHGDYLRDIAGARDIVKLARYDREHGIGLCILGIEDQNRVHYAMSLRVMEYDAASYKRQYQENAKKYRNESGLTPDEFLSKMKKADKLLPIITLVIYYGEKAWDGAKSLKELLLIPPHLEAYVNDYPLHLIEIRKDKPAFHNQQNRDLFQLCQMLYDDTFSTQEKRQKVLDYTEKNQVDDIVIQTATAVAGEAMEIRQEGEKTMCKFFEELREDGRQEGRMLTLISMVTKKILKGKTAEEIAEDLEEETSKIQQICKAAQAFAPEYNTEKIYEALYQKN